MNAQFQRPQTRPSINFGDLPLGHTFVFAAAMADGKAIGLPAVMMKVDAGDNGPEGLYVGLQTGRVWGPLQPTAQVVAVEPAAKDGVVFRIAAE